MQITTNKDYSISFIRLIATIMIVTCHFCQYYNHFLAWWLNSAVQIFLCMSGYLYGNRTTITNDIPFIKKQFFKIFIDYELVILFVIVVQYIFVPDVLNRTIIFNSLIAYLPPNGGEHLWYIPYAIIGYLLTPFLGRFYDYGKTNKINIVSKTFLLIIAVEIIFKTFIKYYFVAAWVVCFIIGFFFGKIKFYKYNKLYNILLTSLIILTLIINYIKISPTKFFSDTFLSTEYYSTFKFYCHVCLGCSLFFILSKISSHLINPNNKIISKILICSDNLSYDIYLVHQFLILGPLSIMRLTTNNAINVIIAIILIILFAVIFKFLSNCIKKIIPL